jgi:hypothetical protein
VSLSCRLDFFSLLLFLCNVMHDLYMMGHNVSATQFVGYQSSEVSSLLSLSSSVSIASSSSMCNINNHAPSILQSWVKWVLLLLSRISVASCLSGRSGSTWLSRARRGFFAASSYVVWFFAV